jgi:hypothetical protein
MIMIIMIMMMMIIIIIISTESTHTLNVISERALAQKRDTETPALREVGNMSEL